MNRLKQQECLRDLGVKVSNDLTFSEQIEAAILSGSQMAGWVLRTFRGRSIAVMLTVLKSLIQPRLDYCSVLWSARDQSAINRLERVQKQFVSQIKDDLLKGLNYWEKLSTVQVFSQERRREHFIICLLWKLSQGLVDR